VRERAAGKPPSRGRGRRELRSRKSVAGRENDERLRRLAEKALKDLERARDEPVRRPDSTADWLRELAEKAQAELDARKT
jgi:hypothetical protein